MNNRRTLIAGFGNVLRGDDGFGVAVIGRLEDSGLPANGITTLEVGTGGIQLAQELIDPYDRLIVVDAMRRSRAPGTLYVLSVDSVDGVDEIDMHMATPGPAMALAQALGGLPPEVYLIGCEPQSVDELTTELSACVRDAVDRAVTEVFRLLETTERAEVS